MVYLVDYFVILKSFYSFEALSSNEVREWIRMICAREPDVKATFPQILAIVSEEERLNRLKVNNNFLFIVFIFFDQYMTLL